MTNTTISWTLLLLILRCCLTTAQLPACRKTNNCQCFNNSDHYEFQCQNIETDEMIILHVYPNSLIKIECTNVQTWSSKQLPNVTFENIFKLEIKFCTLPELGLKEIVDHFRLKKLEQLLFEYGVFENQTLPTETFFGLTTVKDLKLRRNDLQQIDNSFFTNFPNLRSLELDRNELQLQKNLFVNLTKLTFFSLSDNKLPSIPNNIFDSLKSLEKLNLWNNKLTKITEAQLNGLQSLKVLELGHNKIETIEFTSSKNLSILSLRNNRLKVLSKTLTQSNPTLEIIEISGNPGLKLQHGVFSNLKSLQKVDLNNTNLTDIPEDSFRNSTNLNCIYLSHNNLTTAPRDVFKDLKQLQILSISYNNIKNFPNNIFDSLISLELLDLQHNQLEQIDASIFRNLGRLKEINLSFNKIKTVHLETFIGTKQLVKVLMSHNRYNYKDVGVIPVSPFNKCGNLEEIDLSHNEIEDFPRDFVILASLKVIDLSWNNISFLKVNSFWKASASQMDIDLEHNRISRLNFDNVERTALQQNYLDAYHNVVAPTNIKISYNPLICDCFAFDLMRYIGNDMYPGVKTGIYLIYDRLKCQSPDILEGILVDEIKPSMLTCPIGEVIDNFTCTNSTECDCYWRPFDSCFVVDCERRNLSEVPQIWQPHKLIHNQTEVRLQGNRLRRGPSGGDAGYHNVSKLYLTENLIDEIRWLPPRIEVLDLQNNQLKNIEWDVLQRLNESQKVLLDDNPWKCNCAAANFTNYLRQHVHQIDSRHMYCDGSKTLLINLNHKDLCPNNYILFGAATALILLLCLFSSMTAFYYKYQQEIKVWMYAHNICLFLIEEDELDKDKIYDAFVSYSHKDEDFVIENLISVLEGGPQPYKLCLHFRNWIPGEFIANQVTASVRDSRRTLVILSPNFLESVWGKMEFRMAHTEAMKEGRARVIIILYGDINVDEVDDELRAYMKTNTYIKWGDPWFWDKLKYALPHTKLAASTNTQKHANMMKYIEDKFRLSEDKSSTQKSRKLSADNGCVNVKMAIEENSIFKHEII